MDIDDSVIKKNKIHTNIIIQDMHDPFNVEGLSGIMSLYTWEHLHSPEVVLKNAYDALEDGGVLIIVAPQRYYYISIIAKILPPIFQNMAWKLLKSRDVMPYPVFFELCTESSLQKAAERQGFEMVEYHALATVPEWFIKIPPIFVFMCMWMSFVNKFRFLKGVRDIFISVLIKKTA